MQIKREVLVTFELDFRGVKRETSFQIDSDFHFTAYNRKKIKLPMSLPEMNYFCMGGLPALQYWSEPEKSWEEPYEKMPITCNAFIAFEKFYILYGNYNEYHRAANNFILTKDAEFNPDTLRFLYWQTNSTNRVEEMNNLLPLAYYLCTKENSND